MSDQKVIEKAIQKAIDGGWNPFPGFLVRLEEVSSGDTYIWCSFGTDTNDDHETYNSTDLAMETVIFNHDFAKALWGEQDSRADGGDYSPQVFVKQPLWKSRLQEMVVAENPIQYLGSTL